MDNVAIAIVCEEKKRQIARDLLLLDASRKVKWTSTRLLPGVRHPLYEIPRLRICSIGT